MRTKAHRLTLLFLLISLSLHVLFWSEVSLFKTSRRYEPKVEVTLIEKPEAQTQKKQQMQIVEQDKNRINDVKNENAKYLSRYDQSVKHQTQAQNHGAFTNAAQSGARTAGQRMEKPLPAIAKKTRANPEKGELPKLKDLVPKYSLTPDALEQSANQPSGNPSQTDDYLKKVDKGLQTLLSTKEFVYYSYYQRIKEQLRQHWEPNIRERVKILYRKGRTIASAQDHITQVLITLDQHGELEKIEVITQSGVSELDQAAVDAFKQAAPFPNPPKGIVEKDGRIRIHWDFILQAANRIFDDAYQIAGL